MLNFGLRIVGGLGTVVGAIGVLASVSDLALWLSIAMWFVILFTLLVILIDGISLWKHQPHRYKPQSKEITAYMYDWLNSGGRAAVVSRDLSWVQPGSPVDALLSDKAKKGELILFVSKETEISNRLGVEGAVVYVYPKTFSPRSRFTIIDYRKGGSRIAVGAVENGKHTIREYALDSLPATIECVVDDLMHLAELRTQKAKTQKTEGEESLPILTPQLGRLILISPSKGIVLPPVVTMMSLLEKTSHTPGFLLLPSSKCKSSGKGLVSSTLDVGAGI